MIVYDYVNEYIRKTIKKEDGLLAELEIYANENHVPIIHPEVGRMIGVIGQTIAPKRILELGTAIGYSSILFSQFLQADGVIDTIERYDVMVEKAKDNIKRAGLENTINVIMGDALEVLEYLDHTYDMVFLDAAKGQYMEFLPHCLRMLKKGGVLISDNVLYKGMITTDELVVRRKKTIVKRMRTYLDHICNTPELDSCIIPIGDGVAISYKK